MRGGRDPIRDGVLDVVRLTPAARAVLAQLERAEGFRSAAEIHLALRSGGSRVGLSTVYRHLRQLASQGQLESLREASGERVYRRRGSACHSHALRCRGCGRVVEVHDGALEVHLSAVGELFGFGDLDHELSLTGICEGCRGSARPSAVAGPAQGREGVPCLTSTASTTSGSPSPTSIS